MGRHEVQQATALNKGAASSYAQLVDAPSAVNRLI